MRSTVSSLMCAPVTVCACVLELANVCVHWCRCALQVDVMLPFFAHREVDLAHTAVRVYLLRLYRAYDVVTLNVVGSLASTGDAASSRPSSQDELALGLPSQQELTAIDQGVPIDPAAVTVDVVRPAESAPCYIRAVWTFHAFEGTEFDTVHPVYGAGGGYASSSSVTGVDVSGKGRGMPLAAAESAEDLHVGDSREAFVFVCGYQCWCVCSSACVGQHVLDSGCWIVCGRVWPCVVVPFIDRTEK